MESRYQRCYQSSTRLVAFKCKCRSTVWTVHSSESWRLMHWRYIWMGSFNFIIFEYYYSELDIFLFIFIGDGKVYQPTRCPLAQSVGAMLSCGCSSKYIIFYAYIFYLMMNDVWYLIYILLYVVIIFYGFNRSLCSWM